MNYDLLLQLVFFIRTEFESKLILLSADAGFKHIIVLMFGNNQILDQRNMSKL